MVYASLRKRVEVRRLRDISSRRTNTGLIFLLDDGPLAYHLYTRSPAAVLWHSALIAFMDRWTHDVLRSCAHAIFDEQLGLARGTSMTTTVAQNGRQRRRDTSYFGRPARRVKQSTFRLYRIFPSAGQSLSPPPFNVSAPAMAHSVIAVHERWPARLASSARRGLRAKATRLQIDSRISCPSQVCYSSSGKVHL